MPGSNQLHHPLAGKARQVRPSLPSFPPLRWAQVTGKAKAVSPKWAPPGSGSLPPPHSVPLPPAESLPPPPRPPPQLQLPHCRCPFPISGRTADRARPVPRPPAWHGASRSPDALTPGLEPCSPRGRGRACHPLFMPGLQGQVGGGSVPSRRAAATFPQRRRPPALQVALGGWSFSCQEEPEICALI